jgi:hypothetical protein
VTRREKIESFWQTRSNCACVAFMKVMLLKYGLHGGMKLIRKGKYLHITLPDGQTHSFSRSQLKKSNGKNGIQFKKTTSTGKKHLLKKINGWAQLCFAVMVRNVQINGLEGKEYTFDSAIRKLIQAGVNTSRFHVLLGLRRSRSYPITLKRLYLLKKAGPVLIFNDKHIVAAAGGYYDDYGTAVKIKKEIPFLLGKKATSWYRVV